MRMMLKIRVPIERGNAAIADGSLPRVIGNALETLHPEAAYFTLDNGWRTAFMFFEMKDNADMPAIGEPFFNELGAELTFTPAMNAADLKTGLSRLAAAPKR